MKVNPIGVIKKHKLLFGGALVLILLWAAYSRASAGGINSSQGTGDSQAANVQAATQLQIAQLNAQVAQNQTTAAANVESQRIAAELQAALTTSANSVNNNYITAQRDQNIAALNAQTQNYVSSLQATVAGQQIQGQTDLAQISAGTTIASIEANSQNVQALAASQVQQSINNANASIAQSRIYAQQQQSSSWLGLIGDVLGFFF